MLEREGYEVVLASSAEEGLAAFETAPPHGIDLLIADVSLSHRSGFELAADIVGRGPEVKVLFISGHGEDVDRQSRSIPGASFLGKPFTPQTLVEAVEALLHPPV